MGDAGRYTCEALNQAGRSEKHFNLNVWGEPSRGPWAALPGPALTPRAWGTPAPSSPPLICSDSVAPVFPSREPLTLTVSEGHPARLSCECRGVPFPKISWRKDGRILPSPTCLTTQLEGAAPAPEPL